MAAGRDTTRSRERVLAEEHPVPPHDVDELDGERLGRLAYLGLEEPQDLEAHGGVRTLERRPQRLHPRPREGRQNDDDVHVGGRAQAVFGGAPEKDDSFERLTQRNAGLLDEFGQDP